MLQRKIALEMTTKVCRLCLSEVNLSPLFENGEQVAEFSSVLFLTTGLKIRRNDGLPQKICDKCNEAVNNAMDLRNRSHLTQERLVKLQEQDNKLVEDVKTILYDYNVDYDNDLKEDNREEKPDEKVNIIDKNMSIIKDIIADNGDLCEDGDEIPWPPPASIVKRLSITQKRKYYLGFVDGTYDPDGPITCKICKITIGSWVCFLTHCKLHFKSDFICEYCGKGMVSLTRLKKHMKTHKSSDLICEHCDYHAATNIGLKRHIYWKHTSQGAYVCEICGYPHYGKRCPKRHKNTQRNSMTSGMMKSKVSSDKRTQKQSTVSKHVIEVINKT